MQDLKTERLTLEDGRRAERRIYIDDQGDEVTEMHIEPKCNLVLEKRIINKKKEMLAEQRIETIRDGEVVDVEVHSTNLKPIDLLPYVTKEELAEALKEILAPLKPKDVDSLKSSQPSSEFLEVKPLFTAQSMVAERVEETNKAEGKNWILTVAVFGIVALFELVVLAWGLLTL